ncbi:hypothetical protein niasHT_017229 [Heterodera trifolii]|uniref:Uncharacterized protein n=1 Tax=Heterodera trifolii TaxID=157864 RepID=A0ABD2L377_9BILA
MPWPFVLLLSVCFILSALSPQIFGDDSDDANRKSWPLSVLEGLQFVHCQDDYSRKVFKRDEQTQLNWLATQTHCFGGGFSRQLQKKIDGWNEKLSNVKRKVLELTNGQVKCMKDREYWQSRLLNAIWMIFRAQNITIGQYFLEEFLNNIEHNKVGMGKVIQIVKKQEKVFDMTRYEKKREANEADLESIKVQLEEKFNYFKDKVNHPKKPEKEYAIDFSMEEHLDILNKIKAELAKVQLKWPSTEEKENEANKVQLDWTPTESEADQFWTIDQRPVVRQTLWIIRHAEREDNVNKKWGKDLSELEKEDSPLSERGIRQAEELGRWFGKINVDRVYASPFIRCLETANELIGGKNYPRGSIQQGTDQRGSDQKESDKTVKGKNQKGKGSDQKGSDQKGSDQKGSGQKESDQKGSDQKGSDQKGSDQKGSDQKESDQKGSDQKGSDQKGSDQKGSDQKGSDQKESDQKESDQKGSDQKESDKTVKGKNQKGKGSNKIETNQKGSNQTVQGNDQKMKESDQKESDQKGSDQKGSDQKESDQKESDQKGSDQKGSDQKESDQKESDQKGSDQKGSDQKGSDQKESDKTVKGKNQKGKRSDQKGSDQKGTDQKGSDQKESDQKESDQKESDQKGSDQKESDQKESDQKGSDQKGSDQKGSDQKGSDQKESDKTVKGKNQKGKGSNQIETNQKGSNQTVQGNDQKMKESDQKGEGNDQKESDQIEWIDQRGIFINCEPGLAEFYDRSNIKFGFKPCQSQKTFSIDSNYLPLFNGDLLQMMEMERQERSVGKERSADDHDFVTVQTIRHILENNREAENIVFVTHMQNIGLMLELMGAEWAAVGQATISKLVKYEENVGIDKTSDVLQQFRLEYASGVTHLTERKDLRPR